MTTDIIANKYRIVREIARSNDIVYEAVDTTMGRRLAVKELLIPPNLTGVARRERIERFNREARAAGRLSHPNIVTVYDFGEDNGRYFIAMEFLEGGTLRDILQTRGSLPVEEAVDIACQVLAALQHAHSHQVIHRDVKPDNIHILPDGQIKLTDFGIARLTEEASLTGEGQIFGTPSYMSPEQIEGRFIDHRSDIFSLGVVLYEMLAGRKPFTGDSVVSITYNIMHAVPPPLTGVSFAVEQVVMRALSKEPSRRYNSAEEMRRELKNAAMVPSMFLVPSTPSNMGTTYGSINAPSPPVQSPAPNTPPPPLSLPMPAAGGTIYAPPLSTPPAPSSVQGPFATWGAPGTAAAPPSHQSPPPPPFPRQRVRPILGEGSKTFLTITLLSAVIFSILFGFTLLFVRAYEQQQQRGYLIVAEQYFIKGKQLYDTGDLESAAQHFDQAYRLGKGTPIGENARMSLAITYNRLGVRAYEQRRYAAAEEYFRQAIIADPSLEAAQYNLSKVYEIQSRMLWNEPNDLSNGGMGGSGGFSPSLQSRYEKAKAYLERGIEVYQRGDIEQAREFWKKAVGEAPGTDVAQRAQRYLDQTMALPNF